MKTKLDDEALPPYIVGGRKFKRLKSLHTALIRSGAEEIKEIHDNKLHVIWKDAERVSEYAVEYREEGTVIHDLQYDLGR